MSVFRGAFARRVGLQAPLIVGSVLAGLAGCGKSAPPATALSTIAIGRNNVTVRVQATGVLEPVNPVEIKSKTAGMVTELPVEVGQEVNRGDLLVQIDPRDVINKLEQAVADDVVTAVAMERARLARGRADSLFAMRVTTAAEHDSSGSSYATAAANLVRGRSNVDIARQAVEDATIRAPIGGTIVAKPVSRGQIITAATSAGGGSSLMTVADLGHVRMRVTVNEGEMGNVRLGLPATVEVDAFPSRQFTGVIEKIEPQAVVNQGVTFFPVLVNVDNRDRLLMPGMNGEVTIRSKQRLNVVTVPVETIRGPAELAAIARLFGRNVDSLTALLKPELVSPISQAAAKAHFAVVALPDSMYELRLVHIGANDLVTAEVLEGLNEGDRVVQLGGLKSQRAETPPKFRIAENIARKPAAVQSGGTKTP
jgi:HlyD family secretion protein